MSALSVHQQSTRTQQLHSFIYCFHYHFTNPDIGCEIPHPHTD